MMNYTGWTIPEGVVTQVARDGVVLWALSGGDKIELEVAKITSNTYAGETTYENEQFIIMLVAIKLGGTITVKYGGVTRVIKGDETSGYGVDYSEHTIIFGTFNGVDYDAETPQSGTLTIEGDCVQFGCKSFSSGIKTTAYYTGVKNIVSLGKLPAFYYNGFRGCTDITNIPFPKTMKTISVCSFYGCTGLNSVTIPAWIEQIGGLAFAECSNLNSVVFENTVGWEYTSDTAALEDSVYETVDVSDTVTNAARLRETHTGAYIRRTQ